MIFGKSPFLKIDLITLSFSNARQARLVSIRHAWVLASLLIQLFFLHDFQVFQYLLWVCVGAHWPAAYEGLGGVGAWQGRHLSAQGMLDKSVLLSSDLSDAVIVLVVTDTSWEVLLARSRGHLTHFSSKVTDFASQSWHESISFGIVCLLLQVFGELVLGLFLSLAQGVLQELLSASLFHSLLLEDVLEQILVALN